ncbi:fibronectin type III domain-containing protein [Streptomyces sp. NPDC059009]|uniref:fibronectin type III domain-containing protein n=1 Tax=Streptomyces sp. NPDC059009 TaxID=3346694 RepID=UPI00368D6AD1
MRRTPHALATVTVTAACALTACAWGGQDGKDTRPPEAPRGVTAQAGSATSVHVMWNRATDDTEVTGYDVYRSGKRVKSLPEREHMVDVTGLKPRTAYTFTVRARDQAGNVSADSARLSVTTPAAKAEDGEAPTRPGRLRARPAGSRAVTLSWSRSHDDQGIASYAVHQGGSQIHSVDGDETSTVLTGLRPGTSYRFTVKARDAADNVSPASPATAVTTTADGDDSKGEAQGTAPTDFRARTHAKDGAYYIDLSWTPPHTGGAVTEYQIRLDGQSATSLVWGGKPPKGTARHSFYVGKKAGESHRVKLRAKLPDGTWGGYAPERTVTTGG